jgi:hypothetical protein
MEAMRRKIQHYNVEQLGGIPLERNSGAMRILVRQMGGCASAETREIKVAATERLIKNMMYTSVCSWSLTTTGPR